MMPWSLDALRELAPGYVLQSLTPEEQAAFDAALRDPATGPELEEEVAAHRATFDVLAADFVITPPPSLRARVSQRIAVEARASARPRDPITAPLSEAESPAPTPPAAPGADNVLPFRRPSGGDTAPKRTAWIPIMLGAALAASLAFVVDLRRQVDTLQKDMSSMDERLRFSATQLASRDSILQTLTEGGDDLVLVRLRPGAPTGPALQLYWNAKSGRAIVHASGLRALPDDRTYQLWLIRDGAPVSVALFRPDGSGSQVLRNIDVPGTSRGVAAFAVTEEPAAGSPQPTMTPFLIGTVDGE